MTDEDFYPPGLARRSDAPYGGDEDDEIAEGIEEFDDLLDIPPSDDDDDPLLFD